MVGIVRQVYLHGRFHRKLLLIYGQCTLIALEHLLMVHRNLFCNQSAVRTFGINVFK